MAARDQRFYKFLFEALRYKVRNPSAPYYSSSGYKGSYPLVFKWSRKFLPQLYNRTYKEDQEYAQAIIRGLDKRTDQDLLNYANPDTAPEESDQVYRQIEEQIQNEQKLLNLIKLGKRGEEDKSEKIEDEYKKGFDQKSQLNTPSKIIDQPKNINQFKKPIPKKVAKLPSLSFNPIKSPLFGTWKVWVAAAAIFILMPFVLTILQTNSLLPPYHNLTSTTGGGNNVQISKTGPTDVPNNTEIIYQLQVSFSGSGTADIQITDPIPQNTEFKRLCTDTISDPAKCSDQKPTNNTATWEIKGVTPGQIRKVYLVVLPLQENIYVQNQATATLKNVTGGTSGGSCDATGYNLLDTNAVTDEVLNNFINQEKNSYWIIKGSDQESKFPERARFIRDTAKAAGFNPALFLALWKTESGYSQYTNPRVRIGNDLGCAPNNPQITTFEESVLCAVGKTGPGKNYQPSYSSRCALSKNADDPTCKALVDIARREGFTLPIDSLESFLRSYGPLAADPNNINTHNEVKRMVSAMNLAHCSRTPTSGGGGSPTACSGSVVTFNTQKRLLPLPNDKPVCTQTDTRTCGRPGTCVSNPTRIVVHITESSINAEDTYQFFATGASNRGTGAHFIIGNDGTTLQLVETLDTKIEVAYAVKNYSDHISIELTRANTYNSKSEAPPAQYQALLNLTRALMRQYNIPIGSLEYSFKTPSDQASTAVLPGVYGHYQLNPQTKTDPGEGLMRDLREDLKQGI